ncbi:ParA family protein [Nocardia higoensis]|uniref:ParA family protein n=1 Tax=Nocardia higoensis TaxID=228599 RepID=A0ABS0DIP4_9NOCA|nr:ParA family protein [Nocardia higoensis]MBF6358330.1 ParA family protein [Nocardia higoensis]
MTTTAVMNLKGGPGKTVLVNGLAHAAAARDEDVLIGDVDPQGNSTSHLTGHNARNLPSTGTLADVLDRRVGRPLEDVVLPARTRSGIYVAPSGFGEMQEVQDTLLGQTGGDLSVRRAFREARKNGRVLFDCRPAVDLITRAAMLSSDNVLIVVAPEFDHIEGMISVFSAINDLYEFADYELRVAGVVINLFDANRNDHAENATYIREYCANAAVPVLGQPIPKLADISRLTNAGLGMDQHPKPSARTRWLADNFADILDGIDRRAAA